MFTVFLDLANPASTAAKPRFMKNTRIAARNTQNVSMIEKSPIFLPPFSEQKKDKGDLYQAPLPLHLMTKL